MAKVIDCECGQQVRAETEAELVAKTESHIQADHPDLVGKLGREDILAMSHEE